MSDYDVLSAVLTGRYSCRAYLETAIDHADIEHVLRAAQRVPSWCNAQPWEVVVTAPAETARLGVALTEHAMNSAAHPDLPFPNGYTGAHKDRRRTCGWQLYDAMGVTKGDRAGSAREMIKNYSFFGAPHVALITSGAELGAYGALDCGGFITGFTLAAQSLGIASIAQAAPAAFAPFLRDWFGLGEDRLVLASVAFGRADPDHPANSFRTARAPLAEWVTFRD